MSALDQLIMTEMEINCLKYQAGLTQEERAANDQRSKKPSVT